MDYEKIDELIKGYLRKRVDRAPLERSNDCPSEASLSDYLDRSLTRQQDEKISHHVATCLYCLEQLDQAQRASRARVGRRGPGPSERVIQRAKGIAIRADRQMEGRICPYCRRVLPTLFGDPSRLRRRKVGKRHFIWLKKGSWLVGALLTFALSFVFPRYFLQFLILTAILGGKWIFDTASTRTLIMIYDAWRRRDREEQDKIAEKLKERFEPRR